jgi:hypothetical protein
MTKEVEATLGSFLPWSLLVFRLVWGVVMLLHAFSMIRPPFQWMEAEGNTLMGYRSATKLCQISAKEFGQIIPKVSV